MNTKTPLPDLSPCEREPIHIPGSIQPHGILLVLDEPELTIEHASCNAEALLRKPVAAVPGHRLEELLEADKGARIKQSLTDAVFEDSPVYLTPLQAGSKTYRALAHRRHGQLVLELEEDASNDEVSFRSLYPLVRSFLGRVDDLSSVSELAGVAVQKVRQMTGFDRVLIYQFDADWTGRVIAEDRNDELPSYFDQRFPASDISSQARELYKRNRLRLIPDTDYCPVPIVPALDRRTGEPIDLTYAVLRSVSPFHLEYMRNMGIMASMSISILRNHELWGLISCHHRTPRRVGLEIRTACDLLAQMLSLQIGARVERSDAEYRIRLKLIQTRLLARMATQRNFVDALVGDPAELLAIAGAEGAAVIMRERCDLLGKTPPKREVSKIAEWLQEHAVEGVFSTDSILETLAMGRDYASIASGLLAISVSEFHQSFILWFRPEVIKTVKWAGDPREAVPLAEGERISLRKSFEVWTEKVACRSRPWSPAEIDAVSELRNSIVAIVLRRAEELADLSADLERSNKELEAFSYSVSHDLRAPFRHIAGYSELLREESAGHLSTTASRYIDTIIESAHFAGTLVDNLLNFSQIGRVALNFTAVDMNRLAAEVRGDLVAQAAGGRQIEWIIGELPAVTADLVLIRQALWNLLANAIKYTNGRKNAVIEMKGERSGDEYVFSIRDNGAGFDMKYANKLFGVFQRLHRAEEFEGTGIGLALVQRIVNRHGGRVWAHGAVNEGATFWFSLRVDAGR